MKGIIALYFYFSIVPMVKSQSEWTIDKTHTSINFGVAHMMINQVTGEFKSFSGKVTSPNDDFTDAQIEFTIDVSSINTDDKNRDNHLKSDDFFNVAKFPNIIFKSTSFKKISGNKYVLSGNLTIRDVTKKIKLDVVYQGTSRDKQGNPTAGFKVIGSINRFDYKLEWNNMVEAGPVVGRDVHLNMDVEVKRK